MRDPYFSTWAEQQAAGQRVERALERHRQHEDALDALAQEYAGRRTVAARLVEDVVTLSRSVLVEVEAAATDHLAGVERAHGARVAKLEEQVEFWRSSSQRLQAVVDEKRALRETRAKDDEEVQVTIGRTLGGWQVSDLEEVAYRLRCGGAVDETPVDVRSHAVTAKVPAPNMVLLERASVSTRIGARPEPAAELVEVDEPRPQASPVIWLGCLLVLGVVLDVLARVLL